MATERKNIVSGNSCILWKLNEAWLLKKGSVNFLQLLKNLKLRKNTTALRVLKSLILKKGLHHFLTTFKLINAEKDSVTFLRLVKFLILKKDTITVLKLLFRKRTPSLSYDYLTVILIFLVVT